MCYNRGDMQRTIFRLLLIAVLLIAISVISVAFYKLGGGDKDVWATVAASLAVITSVFSTYSAQRLLEENEDSKKPLVLPTIDHKSRSGFLMLRLQNFGGGIAYDICIEWEKPLFNTDGRIVTFNQSGDGGPELRVLMPQDSLATFVNVQNQWLEKYKDDRENFCGTVKFTDSRKRRYEEKFAFNVHQIAKSQVYDTNLDNALCAIVGIRDILKDHWTLGKD